MIKTGTQPGALSGALREDTAVRSMGNGRYDAEVSDRFTLPAGNVNGGFALGICLRAVFEQFSAHPDPLSVSCTFVREVRPGPASVSVEPVRHGRRTSVARATLSQAGAGRLIATATFADLRALSGPTLVSAPGPDLPDPKDCTELDSHAQIEDHPLARRTRRRWPEPPGWAQGRPSGRSQLEFWMRLADDEEVGTLGLPSLVDMTFPAAFELGYFSTTTLEMTVYVRAVPAAGWLACRASSRFLINGVVEEDFEVWDSRGHLVAQSRQLQLVLS